MPLHSEPTGVGALGEQEYPPTRRCRSTAGNAPGQLPASGMWRLVHIGGSDAVDEERQSNTTPSFLDMRPHRQVSVYVDAEIADGLHWSDVDAANQHSSGWKLMLAPAGRAQQNLGFVPIKLQPI